VRVLAAAKPGLVLLLALHLRHHFHGPPIDYFTLALAAAASWVGIPGPGEPILITAGVLAARHKLDIGEVLVVAWAAATAGGVAGWIIGLKGGRVVLTTRGPLHAARRRALSRGEEVFGRHAVLGVLLSPSWVPGILRVPARIYLPTNAFGALIWAVGIGLGAYIIGPSVVDAVADLGTITWIGLLVLIVVGIGGELVRRWRRDRRRDAAAPDR
jgi:membrane protein DedA with SNARE-associated domain